MSKDKIPVVEIFGPTIMGEGLGIGTPTMFVRTAVCDFKDVCLLCDSMHAVDPKQFMLTKKDMTSQEIVDELLKAMEASKCDWVTLSGGNPALWDMSEVIAGLHRAEKLVCLETQGTAFKIWISECDLIHVAPKGPGMRLNPEEGLEGLSSFMARLKVCMSEQDFGALVCIKIPIFGPPDLDFAETVAEMFPGMQMSLSVGNGNPPVRPGQDGEVGINFLRSNLLNKYDLIVQDVAKRPNLSHVTILPQLHVLVWGNKQGV